MKYKFPVHCPSCSKTLTVTELSCGNCDTRIVGNYTLPILMQLTAEDQEFILQFFLSSGSLKEMSVQTGKSYPTVRNRLDDMIAHIKELEQK
ncbi:DUF2089 family protein [Parapedobacter indicus]|uniref:DUF2089 domain-containing protein n=1 Tax=Parapedobacter indicus TaxID=1477437 RepID=A0A1I3CVQ1_9SPHI|nr:DUF2089 family protein [Parapedobacter indicus]PPL04419.1 uncharacterized protein DUF2089 [Parapedobacter indicus]SFH78580.1 Protein of unknown function [Parapedobacter indicus]